MTPLPPMRVQVVLPGDPYTGRVGTVDRIISDDEGLIYVVRFAGEPGDYPPMTNPTAYYRRDELTAT
jgi:hypothetical protein